MIESTKEEPIMETSEAQLTFKEEFQFDLILNRPFLFILIVERQILAFGRIKDPYWCKFCKNKHGGGNHSAVPFDKVEMAKEEEKYQKKKSFWESIKSIFG